MINQPKLSGKPGQAPYRLRISRTKIQMSHRPPVNRVRIASRAKFKKP